MTAPIGAIGAVGSALATAATPATGSATAVASAAQSGGSSFGSILSQALDGVAGSQANADNLAVKAATGNLGDVTNYMVAAEQANVATQLTVAVRNNAVQAFQQVMDMPL